MIKEIKFGKFLLENFTPFITSQGHMWKKRDLAKDFGDAPKNVTIFSTTEIYKIYENKRSRR